MGGAGEGRLEKGKCKASAQIQVKSQLQPVVLWVILQHELLHEVCPTLGQSSQATELPHQSHQRGGAEVKNSQVCTCFPQERESSHVSDVQALTSQGELLALKHREVRGWGQSWPKGCEGGEARHQRTS